MGNFDMLPFEITLEFLSRVPAETILERKLVSKAWRNVVQHPSFSQRHLDRLNELDSDDSSGNLSLILYTTWSGEEELEPFYYTEYDEHLNRFTRTTRINVRPPFEKYDILHSCNGLICFYAFHDHEKLYPQPAYICNPITREYIVLPIVKRKGFLSGFGCSPSTNEYKAVRICNDRGDPNYGIIQVYTLGSGFEWRNGRKMDYDVICFSPRGVFANGAIHWVDNFKGTVVAFDLADEEFRELPSLPHTVGGVELRALRGFYVLVITMLKCLTYGF
ncbi:F-box protein At3g07870-like [Papaver somniferum]|uniref:F-box protein At3g07870-like n=1 Tax=Papaver somniferum TaxID=3469 RepID=UPI000E6FC362|nr:F-box protein At3g07870-like [Papaver somniferum]XP_026420890.1 F-box protein At3g07870-like [Papaver somniferum]